MFYKGLILGIILGVILVLFHRAILKVAGYIFVLLVLSLPVVGVGYAFYFHTQDTIIFSILIISILSMIAATKLLVRCSFLDTEESAAIVFGMVVNIGVIYASMSCCMAYLSFFKVLLFVIVIAGFQIYAFMRAYNRCKLGISNCD